MNKKNKIIFFILLITIIFIIPLLLLSEASQSIFKEKIIASLVSLDFNLVRRWETTGGLTTTLQKGSRGQGVRILQATLSSTEDNIFPNDMVTGYYGPLTAEAVSKWQEIFDLPPVGIVGPKTRAIINDLFLEQLCPEPTKEYKDNKLTPLSPDRPLPLDYFPENLIEVSELVQTFKPTCLQETSAHALKAMFDQAQREGVYLVVLSGFRRPEIQELIHDIWLNIMGKKAKTRSAQAGFSEHQLGTTVDLSSPTVNYQLTVEFEKSKEFEWLVNNAHQYGFIMSYPKDKTEITGYDYEPWHWRFIGEKEAEKFKVSNLTLLEYLLEKEAEAEETNLET